MTPPRTSTPAARAPHEVPPAAAGRAPGVRATVSAYLALTKPRVIELLLVTTVPAMVVAAGGLPPAWLIAATLVGGWLGAGSANAFNSVLEADIDRLMARTRRRPLPSARVGERPALVFAGVLAVASAVWTAALVNLLSAALIAAAGAFYVLVYTLLLKRRTAQNIVIGGAAGCVPVLVGWAAVTGGLSLFAWVLFALVFLWTPPHFWALALRYRDDYAAAGVPMLPVVVGVRGTTPQILAYTVALVMLSFGLVPLGAGWFYASAATVLGAWFLWRVLALHRHPDALQAMRTFRCSIAYLGLLFAALAVDVFV